MGTPSQSLKPLLHQAINLVEAHHNQSHGKCMQESSRLAFTDSAQAWLEPNSNRDLAARLAYALAIRTKSRVGYFAMGERAIQAVTRMRFAVAGVEASKIPSRGLADEDFPRLTHAAGKIAALKMTIWEPDKVRTRIPTGLGDFIRECRLSILVVDDPDVGSLGNPALRSDQKRWQVGADFREAVRGTNVMIVMPG